MGFLGTGLDSMQPAGNVEEKRNMKAGGTRIENPWFAVLYACTLFDFLLSFSTLPLTIFHPIVSFSTERPLHFYTV